MASSGTISSFCALIDLQERQHLRLPFGQRHPGPFLLRLPGRGQGLGNFRISRDTPPGDYAAVDRRDAHNIIHDDFTQVRRRTPASDDFEIARQFPVGDRLAKLALFPMAGHCIVIDEQIAEQIASGRRGDKPVRRI